MIKKSILIIIMPVILSTVLFVNSCHASNILIEANKQKFDAKTNTTTFEGDVKVDADNIRVKSPKAIVKMGTDGKPASAKFVNGAYAIKNDGASQSEVKANTIHLTLLDKRIVANGNARSMVSENKKPVMTIKASDQEFDMAANTIKANGAVVMTYKDIATNSSSSLININASGNPDKVTLTGAARVVQGKNIINANNIIFNPNTNEMIAVGAVKSKSMLDELTPVLIIADNQQYNNSTGTIMSSGNVKIIYKDYVAYGPKAMIYPEKPGAKPNKILFVGRSNIKEGPRQVEADRIEITMNPKDFNADGNVKTRFIQIQAPAATDKKNKKPKKIIPKNTNSNISSVSTFDKNFQNTTKTDVVPELKEDTFKTKPNIYDKALNDKTN